MGSTGSIGKQALEVIGLHRDRFEVVGLSATGKQAELFAKQVAEFSPKFVATCRGVELPYEIVHFVGEDAVLRLVDETDADIYLIALSGTSGILPTYKAVLKGRRVALANKESLVSAGAFIVEASRAYGSEIIPVDSEHSAIFQCLMGQDRDALRRIILTASGGPFLRRPLEELESITVEEALAHPIWNMGPKITIDSATMMNKGLEVIEARWLFSVSADKIDVLVHPQGIVHSMVEFVDGSVIAQMGVPDMRIPISFALGFPQRIPSGASFLSLKEASPLTFEEPDFKRFPLLKLAYEALKGDEKVLPVILNSANEEAVEAFLSGKIKFTAIFDVVSYCMDVLSKERVESIEDVLELHERAVSYARDYINSHF